MWSCPQRQAGGVITITSAAQPKAILLPLFQLSSCHLQNIMHFGFFYANFSGDNFSNNERSGIEQKAFHAADRGVHRAVPSQTMAYCSEQAHLSPSIKHQVPSMLHTPPPQPPHPHTHTLSHTLDLGPGARATLIKILINIDRDMHGNQLLTEINGLHTTLMLLL